MAVANYTARVKEYKYVTQYVLKVTLELLQPKEMTFEAGQLVSLKVGKLRRQYSIASASGGGSSLEFFVDIRPGGVGSQYFLEASVGSTFEFLAPLGRFTLQQPADESAPIVFLATGTGVAPFRSMLNQYLPQIKTRRLYLYWGLRFEEDIYLREELAKLVDDHPNFQYEICLSKANSFWTGRTGYCTTNLALDWGNITSVQNGKFFLCGSGAMIEDGKKMLLAKGINLEQIVHEKFF